MASSIYIPSPDEFKERVLRERRREIEKNDTRCIENILKKIEQRIRGNCKTACFLMDQIPSNRENFRLILINKGYRVEEARVSDADGRIGHGWTVCWD